MSAGDNIQADHTADADLDPFLAKDKLFGHDAIADPASRFAELRAACPVHHGSISSKFGVAGFDTLLFPEQNQHSTFDFESSDAVLRRSREFSSSYSSAPLRAVIGRTILEMDAPDHHRFRMLIQPAFTKAEIERWEHDYVRPIVDSYIDQIESRGHADLATDFAFRFPIHVTAVTAGLPLEHLDDFYRQAVLLTNPSVDQALRVEAAAELGGFIQDVIDARRSEPKDDLISVLVAAEFRDPEGSGRHVLSDDEIVAFMRLLVPAGAQTTYRALTSALHMVLSHPTARDALVADPDKIPAAIEESLRMEPPLTVAGRIALSEADLLGYRIPAGDAVNVSLASANRDTTRWTDPDTFDIDRTPVGHLSFGQGAHICLGIHAARMELRVSLERLLHRLPNLRFDPDRAPSGISGLVYRTALSLPVVWDTH